METRKHLDGRLQAFEMLSSQLPSDCSLQQIDPILQSLHGLDF